MGRVKRASRDPETVQLVITGPQSVLKETITVDAHLSQTWSELLNGKLGLEVDPQSGIFVSSSRYTPAPSGSKRGWRSELDDEIRGFIGKFERKRQVYHVRLRHPARSSSQVWNQLPKNGQSKASSSNRSSRRKPDIVIPTKGGQLSDTRRSLDANEFYGRPRYHNANGIPRSGNQRSQQKVYPTRRLQRHYEETLKEANLETGKPRRNTGYFTRRQANLKRLRNNAVLTTFRRQRRSRQKVTGRNNEEESDSGVPDEIVVKFEEQIEDPVVEEDVNVQTFKVEEQGPHVEEEVDAETGGQDGNGNVDANGAGVGTGNENGGNSSEQVEVDAAGDEENGNDDNYSFRRFDDNLSWRTAAATEMNELRREGIQVEDVKSLVMGRVDRFSNAFLLRVRHEIRQLQQNHRWDRNVSRAPLMCYMLQEVLK